MGALYRRYPSLMIIDVWSDVVCPWCFIGKRKLEKAIERLQKEHRNQEITVRHRAFQLQPDAIGIHKTSELLGTKYGASPDQVAAMQANVCSIADGVGLCYDLSETLSGNTADAHRLLLWSASVGKQEELLEAMFSAYFEKKQSLFTHDELFAITNSVGLDPLYVRAILESDEYSNDVREDQDLARRLGASGVPFFVIDMKYGIAGAAPDEQFDATLNEALQNASQN